MSQMRQNEIILVGASSEARPSYIPPDQMSNALSNSNGRPSQPMSHASLRLSTVPVSKAYKEDNLVSYREALEAKLTLLPDSVTLKDVYARPWYPASEKKRKQKLGSLFMCDLAGEDTEHICRVMKFERITSYQMEKYFTDLAKIHMSKLTRYVLFPKGLYVNE